MKKEERIQAANMFLRAGGKITNMEIAKLVEVNRLTVGRWKRDDNGKSKLKAGEHAAPQRSAGVIRKKAAHEKAVKLYMEVAGTVTNKELAKKGRSQRLNYQQLETGRWVDRPAYCFRIRSAGRFEGRGRACCWRTGFSRANYSDQSEDR